VRPGPPAPVRLRGGGSTMDGMPPRHLPPAICP
jgi:hypothetical protein